MQKGSLVRLRKDFNYVNEYEGYSPYLKSIVKWLPEHGEIYTVKNVAWINGIEIITFEEKVAASDANGEYGFDSATFKEIQSPVNISELVGMDLETQ